MPIPPSTARNPARTGAPTGTTVHTAEGLVLAHARRTRQAIRFIAQRAMKPVSHVLPIQRAAVGFAVAAAVATHVLAVVRLHFG
jgi:hypothetical protein